MIMIMNISQGQSQYIYILYIYIYIHCIYISYSTVRSRSISNCPSQRDFTWLVSCVFWFWHGSIRVKAETKVVRILRTLSLKMHEQPCSTRTGPSRERLQPSQVTLRGSGAVSEQEAPYKRYEKPPTGMAQTRQETPPGKICRPIWKRNNSHGV